ncbi:hypothetical protein HY419_00685 [candidate division WWE3 bacterium]|nr:hypothetical protein [candidate division WWE3 bacterium]
MCPTHTAVVIAYRMLYNPSNCFCPIPGRKEMDTLILVLALLAAVFGPLWILFVSVIVLAVGVLVFLFLRPAPGEESYREAAFLHTLRMVSRFSGSGMKGHPADLAKELDLDPPASLKRRWQREGKWP